MRKDLMWFFNPECPYCDDLEPEVVKFAETIGAHLHRVKAAILDEDNIPQVPALMFSDPKVENHIFIGRFCLDALRYMLYHG